MPGGRFLDGPPLGGQLLGRHFFGDALFGGEFFGRGLLGGRALGGGRDRLERSQRSDQFGGVFGVLGIVRPDA